ncbi:MAG: non-ribosomal peptide synthetase [Synergistaceae bacterium]|jgi:acyl-CoA synthetase (AMP-forming)/AMP-acid ligase II/acyl carrier protein|nr:non-ribosomal peptide synthetase [Synergistaceae bacterium]
MIQEQRQSAATLTFLEADGQTSVITCARMYHDALMLLGALQSEGLRPFDNLNLRTRGNRRTITALWACWLGCIVPVSPVPTRNVLEEDTPVKTAKGATLIDDEKKPKESAPATTLRYQSLSLSPGDIHKMSDSDRALLQHTSGSTASPRRAILTGANLRTGALASSVVAREHFMERYLGWLPLSHIFGLVGCHLVPLFNGFDQFLMDTGFFLKDPAIWLRMCGEWGCTVTASSLFGLELALRAVRDEKPRGLDLSSVNVCLCGGENLRASTLLDFETEMSRFGWHKGALCPAYGLSEATMGVSCKPPGEDIRVDVIDPESVLAGEPLRFVETSNANGTLCGKRFLERVSVGVLDSCNEAIVRGRGGERLPEENLGIVHLRGGNICAGYDPDGPNPDDDGWLDTGDLGYFRRGRLTIFGRHKDIVCYNGLNLPRRDMEESASRAAPNDDVAIVETAEGLLLFGRDTDPGNLSAAAFSIQREWSVRLAGIVEVPILPRTPKGTVDRAALAAGFESGLYEARRLASLESGDFRPSAEERNMAEIWSRVLDVPLGSLSGDSHFVELGGDSLSLFDLAAAIEDTFGVSAETSQLRGALTLKEAALLVERLRNPGRQAPDERDAPL